MATQGQTSTLAGAAAVGATLAAVAAVAPKLGGALGAVSSSLSQAQVAAAAFANRATFGSTDALVNGIAANGVNDWLISQMNAAPTAGGAPAYWLQTPTFHLDWVMRRQADFDATYQAALAAAGPDPAAQKAVPHRRIDKGQFQESFWARAILGDDQLRHRLTLALSEIFVVSFSGSTITARIGASWYDMLSARAFGNYFDLIKAVTLHPAMGLYLNIVGNAQADKDTTRHPDENYAREIMQLMSIGLVQLNLDGSTKLSPSGAPIPTYTHDDIAELAKAFTGWGWYSTVPNSRTFSRQPADGTNSSSPDIQNLIAYPAYHSQLSKTFLGSTIPAYTGPSPTTTAGAAAMVAYQTQSLDTALKIIFNHPNVGPFVARRLIQRFVTSNPSPGYIARVAQAFNNTGGVRGDILATLKAVLMDTEATDQSAHLSSNAFGKLREPIIRMANFLRACEATSKPTNSSPVGDWLQPTDFGDPTQLDQAPLESPTVFNFFDPFFTPPGSATSNAGLVAPEFQAVDVLTVAAYANVMTSAIQNKGWPGGTVTVTYSKEMAALGDPTKPNDQGLIDRINLLFFGGTMSSVMAARLTRVLASTSSTAKTPTTAQLAAVLLDKVRNALLIALTSPEYIVQR